jgi:isocitrate/isopropylmalate dehydrogenase
LRKCEKWTLVTTGPLSTNTSFSGHVMCHVTYITGLDILPLICYIVATNLHGDILSDLAAALAGSIGEAPSSNLNPTREYPSMFEPIRGRAPDITGLGVANPVGTFWSAAEMFRWLGEGSAAEDRAIERVLLAGIKTRDVNGTPSTLDVTEAVMKELESVF